MAGYLLVAAQFALLGWLLWPFTSWAWSPVPVAMLSVSAALGLWTLGHNRIGNFNIHPEPAASGRLVTSGPYRHVRHPMYSALLVLAAALAVGYDDPWKWPAWALLLVVLLCKALLEERRMREKHPDYAAYAARVRRLLPGVL